jgi:rSAM/selenodomain-associated transferase 2
MNRFAFVSLGIIWMVDIVFLIISAPLGKHVYGFGTFYCAGFILMVSLVRYFPRNWNAKNAWAVIFALGVMARLVFLVYPHGNDIYRYIWEGHIQNLGFNPYALAPESILLADAAGGHLKPIWQAINHKELSAAYPPFTLLLFRFLAYMSFHPFFFKLVILLFDMGTMIVLAIILKLRKLSPARLLLYAANPLVILYIAGEGHFDVIQVFFICLGICLLLRNKASAGYLAMGLAFVTKFFAIIAVPFWVNSENRKKLLFCLLPLLCYVPFFEAGGAIFKSLIVFGTSMHYNDSIAVLFRFLFADQAALMLGCSLGICLIWIYLTIPDPLRASYLAIGCLLVLLPTLHPWYLVLIAPFLVFFPSRAWLYLQAAVVFTFPVAAIEFKSGVFQEISWLKLFEYIPFFGLLILDFFRPGQFFGQTKFHSAKSISVIIPTLNEADILEKSLKNLRHRAGLKEVVIADGGSSDGTREIAIKYGAKLVQTCRGRGIQIKAGTEIISGDVVFILHADCAAPKGVFSKVLRALEADAQAIGGSFGMRFENLNWKTVLISYLNNSKTFLTGIAFGDQGQFFRTEALELMGGFPALMLMEDVELSLRLKEIGRVLYLANAIRVSGRRWHNHRFSANLFTVLRLFPRYLLGRRFHRLSSSTKEYYRIYYS